jgi:hypothetical protein
VNSCPAFVAGGVHPAPLLIKSRITSASIQWSHLVYCKELNIESDDASGRVARVGGVEVGSFNTKGISRPMERSKGGQGALNRLDTGFGPAGGPARSSRGAL